MTTGNRHLPTPPPPRKNILSSDAKPKKFPWLLKSANTAASDPAPPGWVNELSGERLNGAATGPDSIAVVYGKQRLQGRVVAKCDYGSYLYALVGLCAGEIDEVETLWGDGIEIPLPGTYTPANGLLQWEKRLGAAGQTAVDISWYTGGLGFTPTFPGLAYANVVQPQFRVDGSFIIPEFKDLPSEFTALVRGRKVPDPRPGGTTAYSNNPALCLYHWMQDPTHGCGIAAADIDTASIIDAADWCDDLIGGLKRYELNLTILASGPADQWLETIASHFQAKVFLENGIYRLWVDDTRSDSGILFDSTNSRDWEIRETRASDRPTKVVLEFPRRANNYATEAAFAELSTVPAGTDQIREAIYQMDGITEPEQALRLATYLLKSQNSSAARASFIASPLAARLLAGDRFTLDLPNGLTGVTLFASAPPELLENGEFRVDASEYDTDVYTAGTLTMTDTPLAGTDPNDPPPEITIDSVSTYLLLTATSPSAVAYDVFRRVNFTLPAYIYQMDLVVRGKVDTAISSDLAWSALGDEVVIPLAGNIPGETFSLFWPIAAGNRAWIYHPNNELAGTTNNLYAHQVTIRLRNSEGVMSPAGAIHRTPASALSTGTSVDGGQGTVTGRAVKLLEETANGLSGWTLTTPAALSANRTLTLPDAAPEAGTLVTDASGNISFRKDFSFRADKDGTNQTAITTATHTKVTFGTERFDIGAGYDASNSKFQPGVAGKYLISAALAMTLDATATQLWILLYLSGTAVVSQILRSFDGSGGSSISVASVLSLSASDYVEVYVYHTKSGDGAVIGTSSLTYFSGVRVG